MRLRGAASGARNANVSADLQRPQRRDHFAFDGRAIADDAFPILAVLEIIVGHTFRIPVNLDIVSKGFRMTFPETGAIEFLAFLGLLLTLTVLGWYYRVRLFQGLAFHYALVFGVLIVLDTWFNLAGTLVVWQVGPALILAIAVVACAVLADGCLRIHARYFAVFRA